MRHIDQRSSKAFEFYSQSRRWRRLPADQLAHLILETERRTGRGEHFSPAEWHEIDLMRRRRDRLRGATS
jgi:hypothetical protein